MALFPRERPLKKNTGKEAGLTLHLWVKATLAKWEKEIQQHDTTP
jgi:hypothetical protein